MNLISKTTIVLIPTILLSCTSAPQDFISCYINYNDANYINLINEINILKTSIDTKMFFSFLIKVCLLVVIPFGMTAHLVTIERSAKLITSLKLFIFFSITLLTLSIFYFAQNNLKQYEQNLRNLQTEINNFDKPSEDIIYKCRPNSRNVSITYTDKQTQSFYKVNPSLVKDND